MEKKGKRFYYLEVLRAGSALAVVMLHLASLNWFGYVGSFNWKVFTVVWGLMQFSVPVFFMMSGALFLQKERENSISRIYTGYIPRMVVFLVFWAMIYQIYHLLGTDTEENLFIRAAKNIMKGDTQVHLWFVYAIVGLYVLIPLLKAFTDQADPKLLWYAVILAFIGTEVIPLLSRRSDIASVIVVTNYTKLSVHGLGSYVGFFLLGHCLHSWEIPKKVRGIIYALGLLGVGTIIGRTLYLCLRDNTLNGDYFSFVMPMMPSVIFWSVGVFVFGKYTFVKESRLAGAVRWISQVSLGIYGIHMLPIFILQKLGLSTLSFNALLSLPLLFLIVVGISVGVISLMKKIPLLGRFIG